MKNNLKSAKAADGGKFTFMPIKDSMDKALLQEIEQVKQINETLEDKYSRINASLVKDNDSLRKQAQEAQIIVQEQNM